MILVGQYDSPLVRRVAVYENQIRPAPYRWSEWIARCRTQAQGGLAAG